MSNANAQSVPPATQLAPRRASSNTGSIMRRSLALVEREVRSDAPDDERLVRLERTMTGHVGHFVHDDHRLVNGDGFRGGREFEIQFGEIGFCAHEKCCLKSGDRIWPAGIRGKPFQQPNELIVMERQRFSLAPGFSRVIPPTHGLNRFSGLSRHGNR